MSIFDRHQSGVRALVRTGRHGRTDIEWSEPFETPLYLQHDRKGQVCVLALPEVPDSAEYDPRNDEVGPALFNAEDYNLEILELPVGTPIEK